MKIQFLIILSLLCFARLHAQTPSDALRLSYQSQGGGTARSMGVGGAIGALGADYTAVGINPAGLASYRTSEFVFSLGYTQVKTDALLEDKTKSNAVIADSKSKFFINNFAFVGSIRPKRGNWLTHNWTIGFNRINNYHGAYFFRGESSGSIVNRFKEKANSGSALNSFEEQLAYEVGAIYRKDNSVPFRSDFDGRNTEPIKKSQQGITSGRVNEMLLGYAANYKEKLQIGAAIGIPFMNFYDNRVYRESDVETATDLGRIPSFKELTFKENYAVTGTGINARFGIIYKPIQALRLGLSAQTPTKYYLNESYNNSFNYQYLDVNPDGDLIEGNQTARSPDGVFDYKIHTPWRFTASSALVIGKKGFVSADVEFVDYSNMNFEYGIEDKETQFGVNSEISTEYASTANIKLGAELVLDIFRLRGGFATFGLPAKVQNVDYFSNAAKMLSLGAGLRENHFYFDLAYQFIRTSDVYKPYQVSTDYEQTTVDRTKNSSLIVATVGFKF
jgi:hypothetical protein